MLRRYRRLHEELERSGRGLYRMTSRGAWAASRPSHVYYFLKRLGVENDRLFVDLGSGDGLVACVAGLFTRSVGIEADPELCRWAVRTIADLELSRRVAIVCGDYLTMDLRRADCLYLYPDKPFAALADRLGGWRGTVMVYGPHFAPKSLMPTCIPTSPSTLWRNACDHGRGVSWSTDPIFVPRISFRDAFCAAGANGSRSTG